MNCQEFREAVGAQPGLDTDATQAHAATCPACAAYQREMRDMDRLIGRALSIEVPPVAHVMPRREVTRWAIAASVFAAIGLSATLWLANPSTSLADDVVAHAQHEVSALVVTSKQVDTQSLDDVLRAARIRLKPEALNVTYAMSCSFHGRRIPHLVVQTADGPVTVMVLRDEPAVQQPENFVEGGFRGIIVPAPHGALAVLSQGAAVGPAAQAVLAAIDYET